MKKLSIILGLLFFCAASVLACDVQLAENKQLVEVENAGALLLIQKQPIYEKQTQVIKVKKSGAITIIQFNGKIKDNNTTVSNAKE